MSSGAVTTFSSSAQEVSQSLLAEQLFVDADFVQGAGYGKHVVT